MTSKKGRTKNKTVLSKEKMPTVDSIIEEQLRELDKKEVVSFIPFSWYKFFFGKNEVGAELSKKQVYEFGAGISSLTFLIILFITTLIAGATGYVWLSVLGLIFILMELFFWVFDNTKPEDDASVLVHTFKRKCWNFILGTISVFALGGASVLGKRLGGSFAFFWRLYGVQISKFLFVCLLWLALFFGVLFVFWLFIKLNSLKYKKKVEPGIMREKSELEVLSEEDDKNEHN